MMETMHLVAPLLAVPDQAVWLVPAPALRRAASQSRGLCVIALSR